jgi:chemotaxis protein CheC
MLSPIQKDVLIEILNVHIGLAASLLSEMVNQKIVLTVPEVELTVGLETDLNKVEQSSELKYDQMVMSQIKFGSEFKGNAFIIFPTDKAKVLVKACLGEDILSESNDKTEKLTADDYDVIKEICNVILNSIVGEFGNLLSVQIEYTTPEIEFALISSFDKSNILPEDINLLIIHTSFLLADSQVKGIILVALTLDSTKMIIGKIDEMLEEVNG